MPNHGLLSVSAFAEFSRTTKKTLHHYDTIGLLSPVARGENDYRYYSVGQIAFVNVIRTLRKMGVSLAEIKTLINNRSPEQADESLSHRIEKAEEEIENWVRARKLMITLKKMIHTVVNIDEQAITVQYLPAEAIVLGDLNDYSQGRNDYDALLTFYRTIADKYPKLDLNYPVWGTFSQERVRRGDWRWPDRYYFYNPEGHDKKPAALYVIGYGRGGYGQTKEIYERMMGYIGANNFEIIGNTYEEYPLNEICVPDDTNYLIRVMITVRVKRQRYKTKASTDSVGNARGSK